VGFMVYKSSIETGSPPSSFDFPSVSIITQHSILNFMLVQLSLEGQAGNRREICNETRLFRIAGVGVGGYITLQVFFRLGVRKTSEEDSMLKTRT
jgi:hypothetical protein